MRVRIDAPESVKRITVAVDYDPMLLRARSAEEVDYTGRSDADGSFSIEQMVDGHFVVALGDRTRPLVGTINAMVLQFEAIAPGWAKLSVGDLNAFATDDRVVPWTATSREFLVSVN